MHTIDNQRSEALTQLIRQYCIQQGGALSFADYMQLALYHPQFGYYNHPAMTVGREGDFTTAPELSPVFSNCLATFFLATLAQLGKGMILEMGAGTGRFAANTLTHLSKSGAKPVPYLIYEPNLGLRQQQQTLIHQDYPHLMHQIHWVDTLPPAFEGVIFANEVLDALPVHCFQVDDDGWHERSIRPEQDHLTWQPRPPQTDELQSHLAELQSRFDFPAGYQSERSLYLPLFLENLGTCLKRGVVLLADYGYGQAEYYHPARSQGTLSCFYRHQYHTNPLILTGLQDITAHVDFTYVVENAIKNDFSLLGFTTQSGFLLEWGLTDAIAQAEAHLNETARFKLHQAIKTLTFPTEMGETIKIMGLAKGSELILPGFSLQDRRRDL